MSRIESKHRKIKDPYMQLSEHFFEQQSTMDLLSKYGFQGIGLYIKVSVMLLKNQGQMNFNASYFSTKKSEQKIIEDIINNSGLFYFDEAKTSFSSYEIDEQLEERGRISAIQSERANKRWNKNDISGNVSKTKGSKLTIEEIEELDRKDGIKPRK